MTQSKSQKHVFLIYAHSDKNTVRKLYRCLIRSHIPAWMDERELLPGQIWKHEIRQAILESEVVIVCLSKQFNEQGGFRHEEVKIALGKARSVPNNQIYLIPARLEKCDVPGTLSQWQYVSLFEADGYKSLLKTLRKSLFATSS